MMLGTRDEFEYSECASCAALQRMESDLDLTRYYPPEYYAFAIENRSRLRMAVRAFRNRIVLRPQSRLSALVNRVRPHPAHDWLQQIKPTLDTRFVDVGCGKGTLLRDLSEAGYRNLVGVDPYLPERVEPPEAVQMIKGDLSALSGQFDVVMFHHSLEHILDQRGTMLTVAEKLAPGGCCLIRVPTVSSYAWQHYREHWFQIDAPRHLTIHSVGSLTTLGESCGMRLERLGFDSNEYQILISELYQRDLPMRHHTEAFSRSEPDATRRLAADLNARRVGDQVFAYFRKPR